MRTRHGLLPLGRRAGLLLLALAMASGCDDESGVLLDAGDEDGGTDPASDSDEATDDGSDSDADTDSGSDADTDSGSESDSESGSEGWDTDSSGSCAFGYDAMFSSKKGPAPAPRWRPPAGWRFAGETLVPIRTTLLETSRGTRAPIVMPEDTDDMPLFARGSAWTGATRCYELPDHSAWLSEAEAYDLYQRAAELTTGVDLDTTPGVRTVVGIRGAYPGTFAWHGNAPDLFNDTLALLWIDETGQRRVREFPAGTDTGAYDYETMSSLRPNMRYHHLNGWHQDTYNALHMNDDGYQVRDDANSNGHWDSDRNGWLPPSTPLDFNRAGSAHNIHLASVDGPLGSARVGAWSAGCQVIPGIANWTSFITQAWTAMDDPVSYFLLDARDIPSEIWHPCATRDGSPDCPFLIGSLPFTAEGDTAAAASDDFDLYNCSPADESGPEDVYVLTLDTSGLLSVSVDCVDPVDVDVHLLDGDDPDACLARGHTDFAYDITPGRYLIVVDSFVDPTLGSLDGAYTLNVSLE